MRSLIVRHQGKLFVLPLFVIAALYSFMYFPHNRSHAAINPIAICREDVIAARKKEMRKASENLVGYSIKELTAEFGFVVNKISTKDICVLLLTEQPREWEKNSLFWK